ncbi:hypothetical protein N9420_02200 [Flavobacteriaceae bacterium]|nr:hypothetical protein [Flavobacteriaceae bacterium]
MVVKDASSLFALLDDFEPSNSKHFETLEALLEKSPNFHLARTYHLKALQQLNPDSFDKQLSHTAIATYNRELLYEFIENQKASPIIKNNKEVKALIPEKEVPKIEKKIKAKPTKKKAKKALEVKMPPKEVKKEIPEELSFSEWAKYFKTKQVITKEKPTLEDKFQLIDSFLENSKRIVPDKNTKNTVDLSEKSWASTDELMTETLAKVFVKQKKYDKALQAYQILGLKYPEKNSFFADQIKQIKRLQKLKD